VTTSRSVIAIDPGLVKCGIVYLELEPPQRMERAIIPTDRLVASLVVIVQEHPDAEAIVMGTGTGSNTLARAIRQALPEKKLILVDEHGTSLLARTRYFQDNPPRGWKRLLPLTLQVPQEPIDDYAALLLAERYLTSPP
jgi:RNase H-fold protein (predicted Holliday junction resolvase)